MAIIQNTSAANGQGKSSVTKSRWLTPRSKRFWFIIIFLLYVLLGFFAVPRLVSSNLMSLLQDDLGRETQIEKISFNPLALSMRIHGFEMRDTDGVMLVAFDEFYVNFQWTSLLKWAWTFSHVELNGSHVHFERLASGETRLDRLLDDYARLHPAESDQQTEQAGNVPRLLIRNLVLRDGHVDAVDRVPETPVEFRLSPINVAIQELNTIPDLHGQQTVAINLPNQASLEWSGSLTLAPLDSVGELVLKDLKMEPLIAYLENLLPLDSIDANLSSRFRYHLSQGDTGQFKLDIDKLDVSLEEIQVSGLRPVTEFIDIQSVSLQDGKFRYPEQSLHFGQLNITNPQFSIWLNEDGSPSILDLAPGSAATAEAEHEKAAAYTDEPALPWHLGIGEVTIDGGRLLFSDHRVQPEASIEFTNLHAGISGFNNEPDVLMPFELAGGFATGGLYSANGTFGVLPGFSVSGNATTTSIPLSLSQPYLQQVLNIVIDSGLLNSSLEFELSASQALSAGGSLQVPDLGIIDSSNKEKLLGWTMLDVDRFDLDPVGLKISQLSLDRPYGRFVVYEDMSTNVTNILKPGDEQAPGTEQPPGTDSEPLAMVIGGIRVKQGSMDFADFSLPLPFAAHITDLSGSISTIDAASTEPANIQLEGQVDEYGLARIDGNMNMFDTTRHTDITVEFRNLVMSSLSPYTVAFAGRRIDRGKLDLGLVYKIDEGQLHGENDIVLSDLVLGEKVDHPDAASLPLGLAVSLLKDADGVIRLDLPVEGNVNDPEFRIGGIIWKAFTGLITKAVAAPFKLLGNLIGADSEDFGQFEFLAGRSDLTPPELEKVTELAMALQQRPELVIEVNGVIDREADSRAMKLTRLREIVGQQLGNEPGERQDDNMMLDEETRKVVESMFVERFPGVLLQDIKARHTTPPIDDAAANPVLDQLAYAADLWQQMLAAESITDAELTALANTRAKVIREAILVGNTISADRITVGDPGETSSEDGKWVKLELGVASG